MHCKKKHYKSNAIALNYCKIEDKVISYPEAKRNLSVMQYDLLLVRYQYTTKSKIFIDSFNFCSLN